MGTFAPALPEFKLPEPVFKEPKLPDAEEIMKKMEDRPCQVNSEQYRRVRDHIIRYGGRGETSEGEGAICLSATGTYTDILACIEYSDNLGDDGSGMGYRQAVIRKYYGNLEVTITERPGAREGFNDSTQTAIGVTAGGKLLYMIETSTRVDDGKEAVQGETAEAVVRAKRIPPGSIEAREDWNALSKKILTLVPVYAI